MKVGVVLPIAQTPETGEIQPWSEVWELAHRAEAGGLDSVWVFDHVLYRFPGERPFGTWECWTILSALAASTQRLELGTLVLATPFRNPALLAKMAATADEVSAGRLILGLGTGWHEPEFDALGLGFDHRFSRFEEALGIIAGLLRDGQVDVQGRWSSAIAAELLPRGPREEGPPILIAARGPRMLRLTAEHADAWNAAWFGRPTRFPRRRDDLLAACDEVGRDPATLSITVGLRIADSATQHDPLDPDAAMDMRSVPAITDGLGEWAELGVDHVICSLEPGTRDSFDHLAEAVRVLRGT
ncbi:MAG: LLM class flavin-dependent oxidoreductase [Chloroflexota bacterium]|nr:LLM class flavin-dependent oxidoreductase [Chloroflexota bacterium]